MNDEIIQNIKVLMRKNRTTQQELAEAIGITRQGLAHKLHKQNRFTLENLDKIAKHYNLSFDDLLPKQDNFQPIHYFGDIVLVTDDDKNKCVGVICDIVNDNNYLGYSYMVYSRKYGDVRLFEEQQIKGYKELDIFKVGGIDER